MTLYQMINQDTPTMKNAYAQMALTLSFMRGPAINDQVLQQMDKLYLKCNSNLVNRIAPSYCTNDECLWVKFGHKSQWAFTNTASEQRAYGELANFTMGNKTIDEYIVECTTFMRMHPCLSAHACVCLNFLRLPLITVQSLDLHIWQVFHTHQNLRLVLHITHQFSIQFCACV